MEKKENKTHWKQLINPDYIGAYSLPDGKDIIVKLVSVKREMVTGMGGRKDECTVAQLEGQKPFILNNTNCKSIAKIYKTPYIEEWAGKEIQLFASKTQLKGEDVECLRIRDLVPQTELPFLDKATNGKAWTNAVAKIKADGRDLALKAIEKRYRLSEVTVNTLLDEADEA